MTLISVRPDPRHFCGDPRRACSPNSGLIGFHPPPAPNTRPGFVCERKLSAEQEFIHARRRNEIDQILNVKRQKDLQSTAYPGTLQPGRKMLEIIKQSV
jgi:hypothetical protein